MTAVSYLPARSDAMGTAILGRWRELVTGPAVDRAAAGPALFTSIKVPAGLAGPLRCPSR